MQQKTEPKRVRSLSFGIERLGLTALRYPVVVAAIIDRRLRDVLSASGEELPFASIVVLIVAFDLSLNAAVHYLNRLRLEDRPGEDPAIGVERATSLGPCLL